MKKLLILISVLALVVVIGFVYVASQANSIAEKFKPNLESVASSALGSPVKIGAIRASVFPRVTLNIDQLSVGEDGKNKGLSLKDLVLNVALLPIISGNLEIVKLSLSNPQITAIKTIEGVRIEGLAVKSTGQAESKPEGSKVSGKGGTQQTNNQASLPAGLGIQLKQFAINNAKFTLNDQTQGKQFVFDNVQVESSLNIAGSLVTLPELKIDLTAFGTLPIKLRSTNTTFDLSSQRANLPQVDISLLGGNITLSVNSNLKDQSGSAKVSTRGLQLVELSRLEQLVPAIRSFGLQGEASLNLDSSWKGKSYSANGIAKLLAVGLKAGPVPLSKIVGDIKIELSPAGQKLDSEKISFDVGNQAGTLQFQADNTGELASVKSFKLNAFSGQSSGKFDLSTKNQGFSLDFNAQAMEIADLVAALKPEFNGLVTGKIQNVSSSIKGRLGSDLINSISGPAEVLVKDGSIKGYNLASEVLRAVKDLPFMRGSLEQEVPESQKTALNDPNTAVKELSMHLAIAAGRAQTQDFKLISSIFNLLAQGSVGLDMSLDLSSQLVFEPAFSNTIVNRVSELKAIQDSEGQLTIPLNLMGSPPKVAVIPDLPRLLQLITTGAMKDKASKFLDKVLGGGGKESGKKKGLGGLLGF